ncbi:MAG TPA: hypothetical protein PLW44_03895 [Chitinophagales bacterium]|nr:hypothetical protein [Chitinophagales bacterium]
MKTKTLVATLFAVAQLLFISVTTHAQTANYIMKNNGSGTAVNTNMLFEYNSDYIGIGTVTPNARLQIHQITISPQPDYFAITRSEGYPTPVINTKFIVNGDGNVGIGTATPSAPLQILSKTTWGSLNAAPSAGLQLRITNADGNDVIMISDKSYSVSGTHKNAGMINVFSNTTHDQGALTVVNSESNYVPFLVCGDGTIGMGYSFSPTPFAQLDIRKQNAYNYMLNVADYSNSTNYFTVHNSGYVGIGYANSGNATLQVVSPSGATGTAGVVVTGNAPNNRFLYVGSGSSPATGPTYLTVKNTGVGVGTDDLSNGAQLAIKGSSGTKLDLMETSTTVTNNAQIRFIASDGTTVRHLITENASGNLLIDPAVAAGSNKVMIGGELETTDNLKVTGTGYFTGKVRIGTTAPSTGYTGYMLGVDGDIVAKKVIVQTSSWADKVFAPNYNLRSLADVEAYIKQNRHLPEIPSESEVLEKGSDVGQMNTLLLQKVEELTLYIIDLQKQIDELKSK